MYFQKIRHPSNFRFADKYANHTLQLGDSAVAARIRDLGDDVFHIELNDEQRWPLDARLLPLYEDQFKGASSHTVDISSQGTLSLCDGDHATLLGGLANASIGACGSSWMVQFGRDDAMRFYGQGEKTTGLEKTGLRTKFWNADVWADHAMPTIENGQADPQYAAIPYLLIRTGDTGNAWVGILVDHPGAVFMDTGSNWYFGGRVDPGEPKSFWFGADQGVPAFYVIAGASVAAVTERLQKLVGTTPLPPLWSLGHHQCRWGYKGMDDLAMLDAAFSKYEFPCDGLWLDIDYMERYKVFTTNREHFPTSIEERGAMLAALHDKGRRVVPILDPGVKVEDGYAVAESGLRAGIYCQTAEGQPYVGFVWPGRTWFPDFSLPEGRSWWAGYAQQFRQWGFGGAWIDMNDPAVGAAELDDMRFQKGTWDHWTYHNIYATGMAQATREGFLAAKPDERPFLISRSAATGSSRYTAVWTGDNISNWHHLRTSIHGSINLALSGIPFNGPDVPGFGGHADRELAIAWYKAGAFFPFLRNHANAGTARQEPWEFGPEALHIIRHYVRLRYKLLPYFYQLWVAQERDGSAVMRPLFYDFDNSEQLQLDYIDDQFLIGPALMQAPLVHQGKSRRSVALPGNGRWMDAGSGQFLKAGGTIEVDSNADSTPVYLREGSLIPMQLGLRTTQANDLSEIELHLILGKGYGKTASLDYVADDGLSYGYQRGERSSCNFQARRDNDGVIHVSVEHIVGGWQAMRIRLVAYDGASRAVVSTPAGTVVMTLAAHEWAFSGEPLATAISDMFVL